MADNRDTQDREPDGPAPASDADLSDHPGDPMSGSRASDEIDDAPPDPLTGVEESSGAAYEDLEEPDDEEDHSFLEEVEREELQDEAHGEEDPEEEPTVGNLPRGRDAYPWDEEARGGRDTLEAGRNIYHAGRDIKQTFYNLTADEKPSFEPVAETSLRRSKTLFVRPPDYERTLEAVRSAERRPVVLIHGPDHSGKWTCALNLAQDLTSGASPANVVEYSRHPNSEIPIASAISSADFPPGTIVLLADCFERNVRRKELETTRAQGLSALVHDKGIHLILTGEIDRAHLASLGIVALSAQVAERDLQEIFEKNLDYLTEHSKLVLSRHQFEAIRNLWSKHRLALSTPFHIHQLFSKLLAVDWESLDNRSTERALAQKAREVALGGQQAAREWFDDLHPNERFQALLVYLFEGAERRWLEGLSRHLVQRFRTGGFGWFSDPREHGLEDARERIHAIERGGRLELEDRIYERELRRQVGNRQHLLWEALEFVAPLEPRDQWLESRQRQALGVALGRLGLQDRVRFAGILGEMAADRDWARAVVPGYALQEVVRQAPGSAREVVFKQLRSWIRSRDHKRMWAAGAGLWRVYLAGQNIEDEQSAQAIKAETFELLRLLTLNLAAFDPPDGGEADSKRNPDSKGARSRRTAALRKKAFGANLWCVVEALRQITLTDPQYAVAKLKAWMKRNNASLAGVRRRATRVVYETFTKGNTPSEDQLVPLLQLIEPLLERASERSHDVKAVFFILRSWLRSSGLPDRVHGELMYLATFGGKQVRERLRAVLARLWLDPQPAGTEVVALKVVEGRRGARGRPGAWEKKKAAGLARLWCSGTEDDAHKIAQAVVTRCYAVDGALPCLPRMGRGIAIIDPAVLLPTDESDAEPGAGAVWRFLALLESRMDITVLRLGQTEPVGLVDEFPIATELLPCFPTQRILMPGIEALRRTSNVDRAGENVYVMALRPPHDLEDLSGQRWLEGLYYLGPSQGVEGPNFEQVGRSVHLELAWPPSPEEVDRTITALESSWARDLTSAAPEQWLELIRSFGFSGTDPGAGLALLESSARELDEPRKAARSHDDPLWRCLVLVLWWASTDLQACLGWVASWLSLSKKSSDSRPRRVIAQAAAAALIRMYTAYPGDGSGAGRAPTLLFELLAQPLSQCGPEGVGTVLRLLEHWLEDAAWADYLAGDARDGAGRLERWASEFLCDRPEAAARLAARVAEAQRVDDISQTWAALSAVVGRLEALRALEHPGCLPQLEEGQLIAILVLDAGKGAQHHRRRQAAVAAELHQTLVKEGWGLLPAIYRLGERRPFWAGTEETPSPARLAPSGMNLPNLIGPLLLSLEAKREHIALVLLLTDGTPADLDDWRDSPWWIKVKLYCGGSSPISSFSTLPKPVSVVVLSGTQEEERTEAGQIAAYLRKRFGPSPPVPTAERAPDGASTVS